MGRHGFSCRRFRESEECANLRNEVLGWEGTDQFAAADPAAYVLQQHFGNRRDGGRVDACFLDGNGPGDRQVVDGCPPIVVLTSGRNKTRRRDCVSAALVYQIGHQLIAVDFDDVRRQVRAPERQLETPAKEILPIGEYQRQPGDLLKVYRTWRYCRRGDADQT